MNQINDKKLFFFKANRVYNELYFQFPKVLLFGPKYKDMSDATKIAYMLLKERLEFAASRGLVDKEGYIYFTYTCSELMSVLNCGKGKVLSIKKELEEKDLLFQKNMGFNHKTGKQHANHLYLAELEVSENDIYTLSTHQKNATSELGTKIEPSPTEIPEAESLAAQEGTKIEPSKNIEQSVGTKTGQVLNNTRQDTVVDTTLETEQDQILLDAFPELLEGKTFLTEVQLRCIATFSQTIEEAYESVRIILDAKKNVERQEKLVLVIDDREDWQKEIGRCIHNVYFKQKTDKQGKIKNLSNYLFGSMKNCFMDFVSEKNAEKHPIDLTIGNALMYNYLEDSEE